MLETDDEIAALQRLLDASHAASTDHLRGIINDNRTLSARDLVALLTGMRVLSVATVTAKGDPRISALDGHFLHGTWTFGTSGDRRQGPAHAPHGRRSASRTSTTRTSRCSATAGPSRCDESDPDWAETIAHWTAHYGSSPLSWGDDIRMYRYRPHWMVGYAGDRPALLAKRGLTASG